MSNILSWIAMGAVALSLGSSFLAAWLGLDAAEDLLRLTQLILSWQVVAGGLVFGAMKTFEKEIKLRLKK